MDNTVEIIKEARKAGMQVALMMFGVLILIIGLFGFFIYMTYQTPPTNEITATLDNQNGNNTLTQDIK